MVKTHNIVGQGLAPAVWLGFNGWRKSGNVNAHKLAREAYAYGKSSFQVMRTSSAFLKDIETRYENGTALLYNGYIFIFSEENVLITMYKNEKPIV